MLNNKFLEKFYELKEKSIFQQEKNKNFLKKKLTFPNIKKCTIDSVHFFKRKIIFYILNAIKKLKKIN